MGQPIKTLQKKGKTNKEIAESLADAMKLIMENRQTPKKQEEIKSSPCACGGKEDCQICMGFGIIIAQEQQSGSLP